MIIEEEKYCIATKSFPLEFDDGRGNMVNDFKDAYLSPYEMTEKYLSYYDEPDEYQLLKVKITYEF